MRIRLLLTVVIAILSAGVYAADREKPKEQYLCIGEQMAGFGYDKNSKQWYSMKFSNTSKYVISRTTRPNDVSFQITEVGDSHPYGWCKEDFNSAGVLSCGMVMGDFTFNKNNGRFIRSSPFGYIDVGQVSYRDPEKKITDDKTDTPYMEIGKCSPF